ncbi:DUF2256 domain-containing protein [Ectothiorhodospiraceae bacterium WFHF3C12]|nr:DUF2256 domain-containing protein [Ectothiorhodospiraceae bacterium WFHF3C12]
MARKPLPEKTCATCARPFTWRRRWAHCWDRVRYCSRRCRGEGRRRTVQACRRPDDVREEAKRVQHRHGSRSTSRRRA